MSCPECNSQRLWKDGLRKTKIGLIQRFLCRDCGFRFSKSRVKSNVKVNVLSQTRSFQPRSYLAETTIRNRNFSTQKSLDNLPLPPSENVGSHAVTVVGKRLNNLCSYSCKRQVCVSEGGTKNLVEVESRTEKWAAGATKPLPAEIKGKIVEYIYWLEKEGYKTTAYPNLIKQLAKCGVNLLDSEDVKKNIAKLPWKDSVKMLACYAYDIFVREILKTSWQMPKYTQEETLPFVADERELDQLIAACKSRRLVAFLQTLKETYADPGEILKMEWKDISGNVISIRPVKGHNPGQIQVSDKLIAMLNALPKTSTKAFPCTYNSIRLSFHKLRKRVARNLQNPRFEEIAFRTFRHWGGTMIAHYTNGNILKVQKLLRHKRIQNTMKYIHMIKFEDNEFEVAAATTIEEEKELLKTGFDFIREKNNIALYRRPKRFSNI